MASNFNLLISQFKISTSKSSSFINFCISLKWQLKVQTDVMTLLFCSCMLNRVAKFCNLFTELISNWRWKWAQEMKCSRQIKSAKNLFFFFCPTHRNLIFTTQANNKKQENFCDLQKREKSKFISYERKNLWKFHVGGSESHTLLAQTVFFFTDFFFAGYRRINLQVITY